MYLLNIIDKDGHFELIDSDFIALYNIDKSTLIELTDTQYAHYLTLNSDDITFKDGTFHARSFRPSAAHEWDGKAWEIPPKKLTALLAEKRAQLIDEIDKKAETIYSVWTRFEAEYKARKEAAEVFKASGYKGEPSIYITSFATPAGVDNKTATEIILQQAAGLQKLQDHLAALRMRKYELKHPNLTLEQLQAISDDIIKQMDELMEAYKNG
ncbi:hypothetical protein J5A60_09020 [Aggregatibacter sp. oral taxon 513]|uniref:hypothetical protein n=1 Tax=Aggregatibacter sp. oral taxon 513 TaxID=712150 RepID=UPI001BAE4D90|nr:hypothetical protein [Aggregatibacter sp. oral taxon 513]QUC05851.1 hypothetical protein J5A60_09020 [Aggregatibacter sp. oral taxon 513]